MSVSIQCTSKRRLTICTDRLPAFAAVIERAALGKIRLCKYNIIG